MHESSDDASGARVLNYQPGQTPVLCMNHLMMSSAQQFEIIHAIQSPAATGMTW